MISHKGYVVPTCATTSGHSGCARVADTHLTDPFAEKRPIAKLSTVSPEMVTDFVCGSYPVSVARATAWPPGGRLPMAKRYSPFWLVVTPWPRSPHASTAPVHSTVAPASGWPLPSVTVPLRAFGAFAVVPTGVPVVVAEVGAVGGTRSEHPAANSSRNASGTPAQMFIL